MKRHLFIVLMVLASFISVAQNYNVTINSQFQPMTMDEAMMYARAKAIREQRMDNYSMNIKTKLTNVITKEITMVSSTILILRLTQVGILVNFIMIEARSMKCFTNTDWLKKNIKRQLMLGIIWPRVHIGRAKGIIKNGKGIDRFLLCIKLLSAKTEVLSVLAVFFCAI